MLSEKNSVKSDPEVNLAMQKIPQLLKQVEKIESLHTGSITYKQLSDTTGRTDLTYGYNSIVV